MFQRILIANRGEVAARIARAARAVGASPIGVVSEADRDSSWARSMDAVVCLGPAAAGESYLSLERLVQAALQEHCSAVHPGWGFLAENTRFVSLVEQHGLTFIGPPASVMRTMGVKSPAKTAMKAAGLPVIPGSDGPLPDVDAAVACARESGYPVILKADYGGGGRGMRLCHDDDQVRSAFQSATAEALAAFGSGSMYLERFLTGGRHIEVQLLCDRFGNGVYLGERECSIQRKHQKLIEESPSPALSDAQRKELGESAVRAALEIGYSNAGTIEFLRDADGSMYFMEMNTRLQVEHPVSEMVTGVDIAKCMLEVAANRPLAFSQGDIEMRGHSIECRINAEDPSADFRPSPGTLTTFHIPQDCGPGSVRIDTHMQAGDTVSPHYDSLVAKVIVHADTRAEAIETMRLALSGADVTGIETTIPLHLAVLASGEFQSGEYDTATIPGWPKAGS
ncbi:MAG: acetyl-CoA carboxylase biotin carboxylase subunit [Planctomycetota bacterium]|jgi:acetyl-CoA carboxylase biotin carboxylase subunit